MNLVLASASPRRRELLTQIGVRFSIRPVDICEEPKLEEGAVAYVKRLAFEKAQASIDPMCSNEWVLGSDTTVVLDGSIIGKPENKRDAIDILMRLSGRTHQVITAVALISSEQTFSTVVETDVTFRVLSIGECNEYWETGEPIDKAGSYGVQGYGAVFVKKIEGSYSAVVGLPLAETAEILRLADVNIWNKEEIQG